MSAGQLLLDKNRKIKQLTAEVAVLQAKVPSEDQVKVIVNRFLGWQLPEDFNPDCYVSFDRTKARNQPGWWPTGTNLLDARQAEAMVRYILNL